MSRRTVAASVLALGLTLTACTPNAALPAGDAVAHYDEVATDIATAINRRDAWELDREQRHVRVEGGVCRYDAGVWNSTDGWTLPEDVRGEEWQAVYDAVKPVLRDHGFGTGRLALRADGSFLIARDLNGAAFTLDGRGNFHLVGAKIPLEPCTDEALGLA